MCVCNVRDERSAFKCMLLAVIPMEEGAHVGLPLGYAFPGIFNKTGTGENWRVKSETETKTFSEIPKLQNLENQKQVNRSREIPKS